MTRCEFCKKPIEGVPYTCRRCRGTFCGDHRLPENHLCRGLTRRTPLPKPVTGPIKENTPPSIKQSITLPQEDPVQGHKTPDNPVKFNDVIDNFPREKLCEIVKIHGKSIIENPKKLRAILKNLCLGKNTREINAIMSALEEKIPHELLRSERQVPVNILFSQFKTRLAENTYYPDDLVTWSINSWALALGVKNLS